MAKIWRPPPENLEPPQKNWRTPPKKIGDPPGTRPTPPPLWTESQTPVKTLPWPNFVAAGKNTCPDGAVEILEKYCNIFLHIINFEVLL